MVKFYDMYIETEGIILRQIKALGGRRMIVIFSEKYGKISAGTSISERGKNRSALALRPFTYGRYELFKGSGSYSINGAEVLQSFYSIGEDVDKYLAASYALELTDAMLEEEQPAPGLLRLLTDFLSLLPQRKSSFDTVLIAFMLQALHFVGCAPQLGACAHCGGSEDLSFFSVSAGGLLCADCAARESSESAERGQDVWPLSAEQIAVLHYMQAHPVKSLEGLALPEETERRLRKLLRQYYAWHLGIDKLKSEGMHM